MQAARLTGVLFDIDGTLTLPGLLDFEAIKHAVGCPSGSTILEYINELPSDEQRKRCLDVLDSFEMSAAESAEPNAGAEEVVGFLKSRGIALGILTRNSLCSVRVALKQFKRVSESEFSAIVTRDDTSKPKPDPEGVLFAADQMRVHVSNIFVVGDYRFDIEAGRRAGATTVFLDNGAEPRDVVNADFTISRLVELKEIVADRTECMISEP